MKKTLFALFKAIIKGIVCGCIVVVVAETIKAICINGEMTITSSEYFKQVICSIICGIGFFAPTIIYKNDKISRALQIFIHLAIGFMIYFPTAYYAGWMNINDGNAKNGLYIAIYIFISLFISLMIWICFYIYYRAKAKKMNELLKNK